MYTEMEKAGEAVQLATGKRKPQWYVKKESVGKLLNAKPSNNLTTGIVHLLNSAQ